MRAIESYYTGDIHWKRFTDDARFRNFWIKAIIVGTILGTAFFSSIHLLGVIPRYILPSAEDIVVLSAAVLLITVTTAPFIAGAWLHMPRGKLGAAAMLSFVWALSTLLLWQTLPPPSPLPTRLIPDEYM